MNVQERLDAHLEKTPDLSGAVFIADNATVLGDVHLAKGSSVFYGAVLRGDINSIEIGEDSNIQDNVVVHLSDNFGVKVGKYCTVGHAAILHGCTVEDQCLIGMGATVLDDAVIGTRSIVGANSLVPMRFRCPPGSLVLGSPAKVVRQLSEEEQESIKKMSEKYVQVATRHAGHSHSKS